MIQFILMLIALAFSNNNATTGCHNNGNPVTVQNATDPGGSTDPGGDTGGETGQIPPPPKK